MLVTLSVEQGQPGAAGLEGMSVRRALRLHPGIVGSFGPAPGEPPTSQVPEWALGNGWRL